MNQRRLEWAQAFMHQGRSDLQVFKLLMAQPEHQIPRCHALHYLQMACEKIAKAYRIRDTTAQLDGPSGLLRRHVGFDKFMRAFLLSPGIHQAYAGKTAQLGQISKTANALAREIQKLAPAVDDQATPQNAEYPWQIADTIIIPCDYEFTQLSLLREPGGATFLKLLSLAVKEFDSLRIS